MAKILFSQSRWSLAAGCFLSVFSACEKYWLSRWGISSGATMISATPLLAALWGMPS
jgi:hypothetical protein